MGYESKLYFVQKYPNSHRDPEVNRFWCEKIVEVNMCKIGGMPSCFRKPTDCYLFADDGNTMITEDQYGEPLYECSIPALYTWVLNAMKNDPDGYRRYDVLKKVCEGFIDIVDTPFGVRYYVKPKWHYAMVLHFGY